MELDPNLFRAIESSQSFFTSLFLEVRVQALAEIQSPAGDRALVRAFVSFWAVLQRQELTEAGKLHSSRHPSKPLKK